MARVSHHNFRLSSHKPANKDPNFYSLLCLPCIHLFFFIFYFYFLKIRWSCWKSSESVRVPGDHSGGLDWRGKICPDSPNAVQTSLSHLRVPIGEVSFVWKGLCCAAEVTCLSLPLFVCLGLNVCSFVHRSTKQYVKYFEQAKKIAEESRTRADEHCQKLSLVYLENCLWSLPHFDVYTGSGPDCLHSLDIGLSQWIIKFLFAEIDQRNKTGERTTPTP